MLGFFPFGLKGAKACEIFVVHAAQTSFLNAQIFELPFIFEEDLRIDCVAIGNERIGEFAEAEGVNTRFE